MCAARWHETKHRVWQPIPSFATRPPLLPITPPIPHAAELVCTWCTRSALCMLPPRSIPRWQKTLSRISHSTRCAHVVQSSPRRARIIRSQPWCFARELWREGCASATLVRTVVDSAGSASDAARDLRPFFPFFSLYAFSCVPTTMRSRSPPPSSSHSRSSAASGAALPTFHVNTSTFSFRSSCLSFENFRCRRNPPRAERSVEASALMRVVYVA